MFQAQQSCADRWRTFTNNEQVRSLFDHTGGTILIKPMLWWYKHMFLYRNLFRYWHHIAGLCDWLRRQTPHWRNGCGASGPSGRGEIGRCPVFGFCKQEGLDWIHESGWGIDCIFITSFYSVVEMLWYRWIFCSQVTEVLHLHDIRDRTWHIQHCSAKTSEGLENGMEWLVKNIKRD